MPKDSASPGGDTKAPSPELKRGLTLAALGVVFGDIGTSPLYALNAACAFANKASLHYYVLGIVSLFFWTLLLVVTVKYLLFVMRADNDGEGGIFSLQALLQDYFSDEKRVPWLFLILGFGAALLVGDGVITPSISVLSAMEGLEVASPAFKDYVVPLAVAILLVFFLVQRLGAGRIGMAFGPIMLVWFATIGGLGLWQLIQGGPEILKAVNPWYAAEFLIHEKGTALSVLGAVVLCVTGAEALYADMGHFGRPAIARAWLLIAMPALLLNYFGQGALVLSHDLVPKNLFFSMVPSGLWTYVLVGLATVATIIASQAVVAGVFSLTRQAIQLRFWPNIPIVHTSEKVEGQIYLPLVNLFLAVTCVLTVLIFKSSENLAAAYGIAVTGTMFITSIGYFFVRVKHWKKNLLLSVLLVGGFLIMDLAFLGANLLKLGSGGIYPIIIAGGLFTLMATWKIGRWHIIRSVYSSRRSLDDFLKTLHRDDIHHAPGLAVFITPHYLTAPSTLESLSRYYHVFREKNLILTPVLDNRPRVGTGGLSDIEQVDEHFYRATFRFGYKEQPDLMQLTKALAEKTTDDLPLDDVIFHFSRERVFSGNATRMPRPLKILFIVMSKNSQPPQELFRYPPGQAIEVVVPVFL